MSKNDGGPAQDMSMRDWFAGRALSYLPMVIEKLEVQTSGTTKPVTKTSKWQNADQMATLAWELADAMLAKRGEQR